MEATSLRFVTVAKSLAAAARAEGLVAPAFRSPPRLVGVSRSICRRRDGGATVAVVLRSRPWAAVVADMVEGVVAANRLRGVPADRARTALWRSVEGPADVDGGGEDHRAAPAASPSPGTSADRDRPRKVGGVAA
jgi:hypothetical protein